MSESITDMNEHCASRVAKVITKPLKSRILSPTRALMMNRREMMQSSYDKEQIKYARPQKKKTLMMNQENNQDIIRETIKEPEESPKNAEANLSTPGQAE